MYCTSICKYCSFTSHRPPPPSARTEVPWAANETGDPQSYEDTGRSCQLNLPVPSQPEGGQTHIPNPKKNLAMGPKVHGIIFQVQKGSWHTTYLSSIVWYVHTSYLKSWKFIQFEFANMEFPKRRTLLQYDIPTKLCGFIVHNKDPRPNIQYARLRMSALCLEKATLVPITMVQLQNLVNTTTPGFS